MIDSTKVSLHFQNNLFGWFNREYERLSVMVPICAFMISLKSIIVEVKWVTYFNKTCNMTICTVSNRESYHELYPLGSFIDAFWIVNFYGLTADMTSIYACWGSKPLRSRRRDWRVFLHTHACHTGSLKREDSQKKESKQQDQLTIFHLVNFFYMMMID